MVVQRTATFQLGYLRHNEIKADVYIARLSQKSFEIYFERISLEAYRPAYVYEHVSYAFEGRDRLLPTELDGILSSKYVKYHEFGVPMPSASAVLNAKDVQGCSFPCSNASWNLPEPR